MLANLTVMDRVGCTNTLGHMNEHRVGVEREGDAFTVTHEVQHGAVLFCAGDRGGTGYDNLFEADGF